jgi:hypothetical protein
MKGNLDDPEKEDFEDEKGVIFTKVHGSKSKKKSTQAPRALAMSDDEDEEEVDEEEQAAHQRFLRARGMLGVP